jgi:hypothetical protein
LLIDDSLSVTWLYLLRATFAGHVLVDRALQDISVPAGDKLFNRPPDERDFTLNSVSNKYQDLIAAELSRSIQPSAHHAVGRYDRNPAFSDTVPALADNVGVVSRAAQYHSHKCTMFPRLHKCTTCPARCLQIGICANRSRRMRPHEDQVRQGCRGLP